MDQTQIESEFQMYMWAWSSAPNKYEVAQVETVLETLARYSLLTPEETRDGLRRYRAHDLAHQFAQSLVDNYDEVQARALDVCVAYARRYAKDDPANRCHLQIEYENLFAAAEWAAEKERWKAVDRLAWDLWGNSDFLSVRGYSGQAIQLLIAGIRAAQKLGNRCAEGQQLGNLGLAYMDLGQVHRAIQYYKRALKIAREVGDSRGEGTRIGNLGIAYHEQGQMKEAIQCFEQALIIDRALEDRRGENVDLGNLGNVHLALGQVDEAIKFHEQALSMARQTDDPHREGYHLGNMGVAFEKLGDLGHAEELTHQALAIHRELNIQRGVGLWLYNLGDLAMSRAQKASGDTTITLIRQAIAYFVESLEVWREVKDPRIEKTAISLEAARSRLAELTEGGAV